MLGGLASARTIDGGGALFFGSEVREHGAVGVSLEGVEMLPCVSQGATPLGRELTITAAEGNVIHELAGRPAVKTIEKVIGELSLSDRALVAAGLLIGIVIDGGKPEYEQGDFLVRGVLGADPEPAAVAIGASVEPRTGRAAARPRRAARPTRICAASSGCGCRRWPAAPPAGALVFSCNGRGSAMFGTWTTTPRSSTRSCSDAPAAGFFAAGEIGPVGRPQLPARLHGNGRRFPSEQRSAQRS